MTHAAQQYLNRFIEKKNTLAYTTKLISERSNEMAAFELKEYKALEAELKTEIAGMEAYIENNKEAYGL